MTRLTDGLDGPGILSELNGPSPVTVVAFGGLTTEGAVPAFEFFRFLSDFGTNYVLLRDHEQAWYQRGVRGVATTALGVGDYLRELLGPERLAHSVFTGGSMGGYVALFLGSRLGVAEVQAFAPQTFISRLLRHHYKDFRWQKQINRTWAQTPRRDAHFDIKRSLRRASRNGVALHVHVGEDRIDLCHARRISRIRGVDIHQYSDVGAHNVARTLRDSGRLSAILDEALVRAAGRS